MYEDFRIKIISEENIINNHIKIYDLIKNSGINKSCNNLYSLQDLLSKGWFNISIYIYKFHYI